jgi:uncharacterized protein YcfL
MKYLVLIVLVSILMCTGCFSSPQKLIRTICDKCPCKSIDVDGESTSATCYEPQAKENRNGSKTSI